MTPYTDPKISRASDVVVRIGGAGVCRTDLHIVEGIWRSKVDVKLPYIMGHENAGWVEAVGFRRLEGVKVGDAVICHPLVTSGHCLACRRGDDMHATETVPSLASMRTAVTRTICLTGERALIKLPKTLAPKDVAPYTDARPSRPYRAAKKASRHSPARPVCRGVGRWWPGAYRDPGTGRSLRGRDHRGGPRRSNPSNSPRTCGAHHLVKADGNEVEAVMALDGRTRRGSRDRLRGRRRRRGAWARHDGKRRLLLRWSATAARSTLPTIDMVTSEKTIVGNLVGTYPELVELMALADRGLVELHTREYRAQRGQCGSARPAQRAHQRTARS